MASKKNGLTISVKQGDGEYKELNPDSILGKALSGSDDDDRSFIIISANIKDDFCTYSFENTKGVSIGRLHKVDKSPGIIDDDLRNAFVKFNVHLACIDDVFKHAGIEITDIDTMHSHEFAFLYNVTGFKIKGGKEDESIVLTGNKYVSSAGGRIEIETPKIPIDNLSSYKWYNELKAAADNARLEVALYEEGKYTANEIEEPEEKFSQTKLSFLPPADNLDDDFENAKV